MNRGLDGTTARKLKTATRELVRDCGGIEASAEYLGCRHSSVGRWQNRDDLESWISVASVARLEDIGGAARVTAMLAHLAGGVFVHLPDPSGDETLLAAQLMEIMERAGRVAGETRAAIADGRCDPREAGVVRAVVAEAMAALAAFDQQLAAIEKEGDR